MGNDSLFIEKFKSLAHERIQQELNKMFIHNSVKSLKLLSQISDDILQCLFKKVTLIATLKQVK